MVINHRTKFNLKAAHRRMFSTLLAFILLSFASLAANAGQSLNAFFVAQSGTGQSPSGQSGAGQTSPNPQGNPTGAGRSPNTGNAGQATRPSAPGQANPGGQNGSPGQPSGTTTMPAVPGGRPAQAPNNPATGAAVVTQGPTSLSLEQAIQISIQNNLSTLLAQERQREAGGLALQALSNLLPNVSGTTYQANRTLNLLSLGFSIPGLPKLIGPFYNFDARVQVVQTIFNFSAIRSLQAARINVHIAKLQEQLAREQVAAFTALAYIDALRTQESVRAAQANLDLSYSLLKIAQDQHDAGVATGIDVARAQRQVSEELLRLSQAQMGNDESKLQLQRIVGLPQGAILTLIDTLRISPDAPVNPESALQTAIQNRFELTIAEQQVRQRDYERKSAVAEQYPSLSFDADYGESGILPNESSIPTRSYEIRLNVPIFNGGLTRGRIAVASSQKRQAELLLGDTRGQVEQDVRLAILTLNTTTEQVKTAQATLQLAERELQLAQDRFKAGVADNLEVTNAQTALENARDTNVAALAAYNAARVNLAAAVGQAQSFHW